MKTMPYLVALAVMAARLAAAADFGAYKETYDKKLEEIVLTHGMKLTTLRQGYSGSLSNLFERATQAGDLDKAKMVMAETERFSKDKSVSEQIATNNFPDLKSVQLGFIRSSQGLEMEKAKSIVSLSDKYDGALKGLQSDLTKQKKLEEAPAVQEERKKIEDGRDLVWAKSLLKALSTRDNERPPATPPTATPPKRLSAPLSAQGAPEKGLPDPVLWLKCDAIENGVMSDNGTNGNDATVFKVQAEDLTPVGDDNKALRLEGSYLVVPDSPSLRLSRKGYTLSIWCYPDQAGVASGVLISKRAGLYETEYGVEMTKAGTVLAWGDTETLQPLKPKKWYHVAVTLDPKDIDDPRKAPLRIYVNGHEEKCKGRPQHLNKDDTAEVQIGHVFNSAISLSVNGEPYTTYFKGLVDDVRVYNRPLTSTQIKVLYNSPPAPEMRGSK